MAGRQMQVKNRAPAPIQITAEQILREARDRGLEEAPKPPQQFITDREELAAHQLVKRKEFENSVQRNRSHMGKWVVYGLWEAEQKEFERARSVFERAIDVDYRSEFLWTKYAEMEMKNKFINHARNVWDRCVTLHPRNETFWLKYAYMEELAGSIDGARQVFERFVAWEPDELGWAAFIKFEQRQGDLSRVRAVFGRFVVCRPSARSFLKFAKWEESIRQIANARAVYERAVEDLHASERTEELIVGFARFEERCKEPERARAIFQFALAHAGSTDAKRAEAINQELVAFEKRHGAREDIEDAILAKRRVAYEAAVTANRFDYDSWFDFARLEEGGFKECVAASAASDDDSPTLGALDLASAFASSSGAGAGVGAWVGGSALAQAQARALGRVREVYERAIANVPLSSEKRFWRRYVYLWINYALFEELEAKDVARTRAVYAACLSTVPHKKLTFTKLWLLAANFEVRCKDLGAARRLLGQALGVCSQFGHLKPSIFRGYIALELQLGEVDRCRSIYTKFIEVMPSNCRAWCDYAALEARVGETERCRAIFELATSQPLLSMPELLWKAYIDFEAAEGEAARVRALYERLLQRASHVKVWTAFALFEASLHGKESAGAGAGAGTEVALVATGDDAGSGEAPLERSRGIFRQAYAALKTAPSADGGKAARVALLEAWLKLETSLSPASLGRPDLPQAMMPRKVKARRMAVDEDGQELGWEEYYDYHFPDDPKKLTGMKILENALKWKAAQAQTAAGAGAGAGAGVAGDGGEGGSGADGGEEGAGGGAVLGKRKADTGAEIDIDDI